MIEYTLYHGDCIDIMKKMNNESVDLILTDPPYGIDFQSHRRKDVYKKIQNDTSLEWLDTFFKDANRIMKTNTAIYVFCSWHNIDKFKIAFEKYFKLKSIIVWVKNNHGSGDLKGSYAPRHEFILYGNKGRRLFEGKRYDDVVFFNKTGNKYHPTEKPVDLLNMYIENSSKENDIVFDPFMGSGSTGIAALNLNRKFIGVELDENYFNIAKKRIENKINDMKK